MKKQLLSGLLMLAAGLSASAQDLLFTEEFNRDIDAETGVYSWSFACDDLKPKLTVSQPQVGQYTMQVTEAGGKAVYGDCYGFLFVNETAEEEQSLDLSSYDLVSAVLRLKSDESFRLTVNLQETDEAGGSVTDGVAKYIDVVGDGEFHTYFVTFEEGDFVTWDGLTVDRDQIRGLQISFAKDEAASTNATITLDAFKIEVGEGTPFPTSVNAAKAAIASSKLYPNPSTETESASIELSLKEASDVKVTLSDLMGREVAVIANERNVAVNKSFSTANLAKGMYTVNYFINGAPAKAELLMVK
jgi:hypothetical protein